jgi:hypothetical protein
MAIVPVQTHICGTNGCSGKQLHHSKRGMVCEDGDLLLQTRVEAHCGGVDEDAVYAGMLVCWCSNTGPAVLRPISSASSLRLLNLYLCCVSRV